MGASGMSILRLTFLGTSAAQPTIHRNLSGIAVKADADLLLFDCGEGSQRQMIRFGTGFSVDAAFFTHFHADHYLGIIGFLRTLGMTGREEPLTLYGPAAGEAAADPGGALGRRAAGLPGRDGRSCKDGDVMQRGSYDVRGGAGGSPGERARATSVEEDERPGSSTSRRRRALGVTEGPDFGKLQKGER